MEISQPENYLKVQLIKIHSVTEGIYYCNSVFRLLLLVTRGLQEIESDNEIGGVYSSYCVLLLDWRETISLA